MITVGQYLELLLFVPESLIQAVNDESGDVNVAFDHDHGMAETASDTIPTIAKRLKTRQQPWTLITDENYGEGSAREHAALQPRFYGMWSMACQVTHHSSFRSRLCHDCCSLLRSYT